MISSKCCWNERRGGFVSPHTKGYIYRLGIRPGTYISISSAVCIKFSGRYSEQALLVIAIAGGEVSKKYTLLKEEIRF